MSNTILYVENDTAGVTKRLCDVIQDHANKAIETTDIFKIGLSGGSLVKLLAQGLPLLSTDWTKWRFFFCDERIVPFDDEESTYGLYKANLIGKIPVTDDQFIKVDPKLSVEDAAKDYIKKLAPFFSPDSLPEFDILLLGLGPDGHTCSLFPNHRVLNETVFWVSPVMDSPKPPPFRITLTLPVINNAKACIFPIAGSGKADIVKRIYKDKDDLPGTKVQPTKGKLYWILDEGAASKIQDS